MLVCMPRPRHLTALSFFSTSSIRSTSASPAVASTSQPAEKHEDSIFTAPGSPWDHVFSDVEPLPAPSERLLTRLHDGTNTAATAATIASLSCRKKGYGQHSKLIQRSSGFRHQRASVTAREMSVFDEMFDLIFNAVSAQDCKGKASSSPSASGSGSVRTPFAAPSALSSSFSAQTPSIGRTGAPLNDLFRTLRRHTSRVRWTTTIDEELDRKKETMELFNTDHDLLQWVTHELFGEAQQWDEKAKWAMSASSSAGSGTRAHVKETDDAVAGASSASPADEIQGKHSIYPHLIAHAMRIFRTTYTNPSLSLAIFNHAARISIPSYVFGCTAPAYNELIEAKWEGWGDLEGVCNALEEMRANGVKIDGRTRIVMEKVRREVGSARPVDLGETAGEDGRANVDDTKDVHPVARRVWEELGEAEVVRLLHRIERLALHDRSRKSTSSPYEESWKSRILQPGGDDGWSFDGWDEPDTKNQRRKVQSASRDRNRSRTLEDWTVLGSPEKEMSLR